MATFHWDLDAAGAASGDETSVTAANGGTDGPTSVNSVTGGTRVYDNATAPTGYTWSVRLATGATSGVSNMVWGSTRIANPSVAYFRIPYRFSDLSASRSIIRIRNGTTQILRVHHTSSGRLELRNTGNSVAATGTVSMPTDEWIEVGAFADPGNTSTCRLRWWLWGADAADYEDEVVATDNFSAAATVNELTVGNAANGIDIPNYWVGRVRYSDTGWPGPLVTVHDGTVPLTGVGSLTGTGSPGRAGTVTLSGAGALTATAAVARSGAAALAATGGLTASGATSTAGAADLASAGTLAATATGGLQATAGLVGAAELAATATVVSPLGNLADDFADDSIDTAKWPGNYGGVTESGGRLRIDCDVSQWSGLKSATSYFLAGSGVFLRAWPAAANTATVAYLSALVTTTTAGTDAGFNIDTASNGIAYLNRVGFSDPDAVFDTYSPTDHAWLRLSEAGGTLTWETSPDGVSWTVRRTDDSPAWVADQDLALLCEAHRDAGTDNTAEVDSVNVTPSAVHDADADLDGTGALTAAGTADRAASAALAGTGTLTADGALTLPATATLAAAADLAGTAVAAASGIMALAGAGSLAAAAATEQSAAAGFQAAGDLAVNATAALAAAAGLAATSGLAAAANVDRFAAADLSGAGLLAAEATTGDDAAAILDAVGVLDAPATADRYAAAALSAAGALTATPDRVAVASVTLSSVATLTPSAAVTRTAAGGVAGSGGLAAAASVTRVATVALSGVGGLSAVGEVGAASPVVPGIHVPGATRTALAAAAARSAAAGGHTRSGLASAGSGRGAAAGFSRPGLTASTSRG